MNTTTLNMTTLDGGVIIKKGTAPAPPSGGESVEYLDLSGDSPLRDALIQFCYLIKTDGFKIERPGSSSGAERGIFPASLLMQLMCDMSYEEYLIILGSIKAVSIDFNTEIILSGTDTIMPIKDIFTGAEELLDAIPRLTKEQFYDLNAELTPQEIAFTVSGVEYTALSGMTWEEFCNSEYNDGGWGKLFFDCEALGDGKISASDSGMDAGIVQLNGSNVYKTDAIQPNANYTTSNPLG